MNPYVAYHLMLALSKKLPTKEEKNAVLCAFAQLKKLSQEKTLAFIFASPYLNKTLIQQVIDDMSFYYSWPKIFTHLLKVIAYIGPLDAFLLVERSFQRWLLHNLKTTTVKVKTAEPLDEESEKKIRNILKSHITTDIILEEEVDLSILKGFELAFNQCVIDASLRTILSRFNKVLKEPL